jgi:hypothetical protein
MQTNANTHHPQERIYELKMTEIFKSWWLLTLWKKTRQKSSSTFIRIKEVNIGELKLRYQD